MVQAGGRQGSCLPRSRQARFPRRSAPPDGAETRLAMNICWSPEAAADFAGIIDYIGRENPSAAERVGRSMFDSVHSLESFSNRGRPGRIDGTRELVLAPL